ncbi:MAG: hypothetical protein JO130_05950 [Solirubrobacterales bacterium]|nr:hypothetical protein [Solirubrobacterales bacterium]
MSGRRVLVLGALVVCSGTVATGARFAPAANRTRIPRYGVDIQAVFTAAGNPLLVANFSPNGALATPHWSICAPPPQGTCTAAATVSKVDTLAPGPEPAGTRFIARARHAGRTYSASVTWLGRVQALTAPALEGAPKQGGIVDPLPAQWTGGWSGDFDQLGVEACATPSGTHCRMLGGGEFGCPDNTSKPRLRGWFTGWYVFALDARLSRDELCGGTGYDANADLPVWKVGQTVVRSPPLARITGPPRPTVRFLRPGLLSNGTLYVAHVRCLTRCTVELDVESSASGTSRRFAFRGTRRLGVRAANLTPGPVTADMHVDDSPQLRARSTFP